MKDAEKKIEADGKKGDVMAERAKEEEETKQKLKKAEGELEALKKEKGEPFEQVAKVVDAKIKGGNPVDTEALKREAEIAKADDDKKAEQAAMQKK